MRKNVKWMNWCPLARQSRHTKSTVALSSVPHADWLYSLGRRINVSFTISSTTRPFDIPRHYSTTTKLRERLILTVHYYEQHSLHVTDLHIYNDNPCVILVFQVTKRNNKPLLKSSWQAATCYNDTPNKLPRRTALHCITEHKALARRPSIQPNITQV